MCLLPSSFHTFVSKANKPKQMSDVRATPKRTPLYVSMEDTIIHSCQYTTSLCPVPQIQSAPRAWGGHPLNTRQANPPLSPTPVKLHGLWNGPSVRKAPVLTVSTVPGTRYSTTTE